MTDHDWVAARAARQHEAQRQAILAELHAIQPRGGTMRRIIRLRKHADDQWSFQPVAANGEPQATSEPYATKANAERGARDLFPGDELAFSVVTP